MVADITNYVGREQAFVKPFFLESYLESLIYKTASVYDEIAYVDGFSGPWQSTGEDYADTSFGIALAALRKAKGTWKDQHGKDVRMSVYLVERAAGPYANLEALKPKFPDIAIHTFHADFVATAPQILAQIPAAAFAFFFIDPKGWRIDMAQLEALLKRPKSEVVFNFMFDFINRAASIDDPKIIAGLDALMPHGDWKDRLAAIDAASGDRSTARKVVLTEAFRQTLATMGGYTYVAEIPVLQRINDRTLYSLFYGTRHAKGIEVFRDCHVRTERQQATVRTATKRAHEEQKSGQALLPWADAQFAPDDNAAFLENEKAAAKGTFLSMVPTAPAFITYDKVWPRVLEKHVITHPDVNKIGADLRKAGDLAFPNWEAGKRVPHDSYRISKPDLLKAGRGSQP
ncbi:MAG: three-Cys-motif partner protein TcmP [Caulobacteraceae bacterium]